MLAARRMFGSVGRSGGGYNTVWSDWTDEGRKKRDQIMSEYEEAMNDLCGHYNKLEVSMLSEGMRNPLIITCGPPRKRSWEHIPPEMHSWPQKDLLLMETTTGGSRLWVAQKHNMIIPCIVNDWVGRFNNYKSIATVEQAKSYYKDPPKSLAFNTNLGLVEGFDMGKIGYHLGPDWKEDVLMPSRAPIWVSIMAKHGYHIEKLPTQVEDILKKVGIDRSKKIKC